MPTGFENSEFTTSAIAFSYVPLQSGRWHHWSVLPLGVVDRVLRESIA